MSAVPRMTAEDLMALPDDGHRYELSQGVLVCMSPAAYWSGKFGRRIASRIGAFVDEHKLGDCGVPDTGFKLTSNPDTVREPDVWFVSAERLPPADQQQRYFEGAPDLAVEVLSPTDRFDEVMRKVREYLDAGTRLVWVFDPDERTAGVFRPDGSYTKVGEDGTLDGENLLPGFELPLHDIRD
jgi:Uma2 family endonuclease